MSEIASRACERRSTTRARRGGVASGVCARLPKAQRRGGAAVHRERRTPRSNTRQSARRPACRSRPVPAPRR
eukprot:4556750-Prymnesium_polylepis.1